MPPNFRAVAIGASILCFALAGVWLLAPSMLLSLWGVGYGDPVGLIARRTAALFLGVGVMFFLARNAKPSLPRTALSLGLSVACMAVAALGVFELALGRASEGILTAVVVELGLAGLLLWSERGPS